MSESRSVVSDSLRPIQSMEFSRPEYWSGLPCLPPGDLPNPGIETRSPALRVDSLLAEPQGKPYLCSYLSVFLLFLLSQVSSSSTSERANNHQSENSLQNINSKIVLGWMKLLSVIIGQKNILQKYNINKERLKKQELLNPKK